MGARSEIGDATFSNRLPMACLDLQRATLEEVDATLWPGSAGPSSPVESSHRRGKCSCPSMAPQTMYGKS